MSGWHYPDDGMGPWDYDPHDDYDPHEGYVPDDPPDPRDEFKDWAATHNRYPDHHAIEDFGEQYPWHNDEHRDDVLDRLHNDVDSRQHKLIPPSLTEPSHHPDPGFPEEEVDTHPDPDHGREDKTAALQWKHDGLDAVAQGPAERYLIHAPIQDEAGRPGPENQFLLHSMPTHGGDQSRWHYLSPHSSLEEAQDAAEAIAHHPEGGQPWQDFTPEDHRTGAILRQSEQWPHRMADNAHNKTEAELAGHAVKNNDVRYLKDTGLYGEDEDHPYKGVIVLSPHGNGFDVIRVVE